MHGPDERAERAILSSAEAYRLVAEAREQQERAERAERERDDARRWAVRLEQRLAEETRAAYSLHDGARRMQASDIRPIKIIDKSDVAEERFNDLLKVVQQQAEAIERLREEVRPGPPTPGG